MTARSCRGQPELLGGLGRRQRAGDHRLADDHVGRLRIGSAGVEVHQFVEQLRIERPEVHPDPHRPVVVDRHAHNLGEVGVVTGAAADVAWVDPVLGQGVRTVGELAQQRVTVVVEVAHERDLNAVDLVQALADLGHLGGAGAIVDGNPDDLRTRARQVGNLRRRADGVGRVGVGHRLHQHRGAATDGDPADAAGNARASDRLTHRPVASYLPPRTVPLEMFRMSFCTTTRNSMIIRAMPTTAARS